MVEEATRRAENCSDAGIKSEWLRFAGECLKLAARLRTSPKPRSVKPTRIYSNSLHEHAALLASGCRRTSHRHSQDLLNDLRLILRLRDLVFKGQFAANLCRSVPLEGSAVVDQGGTGNRPARAN